MNGLPETYSNSRTALNKASSNCNRLGKQLLRHRSSWSSWNEAWKRRLGSDAFFSKLIISYNNVCQRRVDHIKKKKENCYTPEWDRYVVSWSWPPEWLWAGHVAGTSCAHPPKDGLDPWYQLFIVCKYIMQESLTWTLPFSCNREMNSARSLCVRSALSHRSSNFSLNCIKKMLSIPLIMIWAI